ncbi:MAG TPA: hypothetical protein VFI60_03635 [Candidatus Acidoferrum sp.]|nr:hypothetical protein [Candidatus Acidoferrum sp.]
MAARRSSFLVACWAAAFFAPSLEAQQPPPAPPAARILLLPRRIVSGERATLAVLDVGGRLTPGVTVTFSNGDRVKTDATGRALFVAPLTPGVILGSIEGRPGRVPTVILTPAEASASSAIEISRAPRVASVIDRFELLGKGFCGDADANHVAVAGQAALVLASSPAALLVLPPMDLFPGPATVEISCGKRQSRDLSITFVELELKADASPLKRGEHRTLSVRVRGTEDKVALEARNLAPKIAELAGGNPVERLSSGGPENVAQFEVVGQRSGSFLVSIRLVPR